MSNASRMQRDAMETMERALALIDEAKEKMRLANRFGEEPESGTILVFDKVFANRGTALESRGLTFDPDVLVPNLNLNSYQRQQLGNVLAGTAVVVFDDTEAFAESQKVSYRHVAIRIGGTWYTTSARKAKMTWENLVEFIGDSQCWKVTGLEEIPLDMPVIEAAPVVAETTQAEDVTLAALLGANRKNVMATLQKLRANGKNPTPKSIVDALAKIGSENA
jgi:hypothetical protein